MPIPKVGDVIKIKLHPGHSPSTHAAIDNKVCRVLASRCPVRDITYLRLQDPETLKPLLGSPYSSASYPDEWLFYDDEMIPQVFLSAVRNAIESKPEGAKGEPTR